MSDYRFSRSPSEFDPSYDQFGPVATELLSLIQRYPEYGEEQGTEALAQLAEAKAALEKGEIHPNHAVRVTLFGGLQSRNVQWRREQKANEVVERLYVTLNGLAGYHPRDYYDIEKDAVDLAAKQLKVSETLNVEHLGLGQLVKGDRFALIDKEGQLTGVRVKISDNVIASFSLGNFGEPGEVGKLTFVDLFVVSTG